jgi:hypothetical protein
MTSEIDPLGCFRAAARLGVTTLFLFIPGLVCAQTPICPSGPCYLAPAGVNVGIGTASPVERLQVSGQGIRIDSANSGGAWAQLQLFGPNTANSRAWRMVSDNAGLFHLDSIPDDIGYATPVFTATRGGYVGIGTINPLYKLAVNGNIGAQDIVVTNTGWSDYVFRPGYRLRPLSEVSQFIQKHHHLPDIPSEAEVKEKGVSVGEMQAKLLAKIEELTLHVIQVDERNTKLEKDNDRLKEQNRELQARIGQIEERIAGVDVR